MYSETLLSFSKVGNDEVMTQLVFTQSSSDTGDSRQGQTKNSAAFFWCLPSFVRKTVLNPPDNC